MTFKLFENRKKLLVVIIWITLFIFLLIYNLMMNSSWVIDSIFAILLFTLIFYFSEKLHIQSLGLFFIALAFLFHNLGTFGFYRNFKFVFGYDKFIHFFISFIVIILLLNFFLISLEKRYKNSLFGINYAIFIIIISLSIVTTLGVINEVNEFVGFTYLGVSGETMFSPQDLADDDKPYADTMNDIITNFLGSICGIILFYTYKPKN